MSKQFVRFIQHRGKRRRKRDTAELAAKLAPLEEQDISAAKQQGTKPSLSDDEGTKPRGSIVVDAGSLALPKETSEEERKSFLGIDRVVLVIVGLALVFIAFIAWQISLMPAQ